MLDQAFSWLDRVEYPFQSNYHRINSHQLHYIDEGSGDLLLFVHGTPSWSFDFRNVIVRLRDSFRCIAIDHIGFGLSDKPEVFDYSTINHSKTLEKFVLEKDLQNITLVVHDFGGPIGLHFAMQHPDRIKKMVVLNSWMWSSIGDPAFIKLSKVLKSPLLPFLYLYLNFSPRFILPRSFGDHKPSKKILKHYSKPFADSSQRYGALAFARSLLFDQNWFESLWERRFILSNKPILFVWGMKDPIITPNYLAKFAEGFANSKIVKLTNCGHFPQEEKAEEVSRAIQEFLIE